MVRTRHAETLTAERPKEKKGRKGDDPDDVEVPGGGKLSAAEVAEEQVAEGEGATKKCCHYALGRLVCDMYSCIE